MADGRGSPGTQTTSWALCGVGWIPRSHSQVRQMKVKVAWLLETGFQSPQLFALGQLFSHTPPAPHPPCQLQEVTDDAEGLQRSWSFLLSCRLKKMYTLKTENYVLVNGKIKYLSIEDSLSDSSGGLFQRGKEELGCMEVFATKTK